MVKMTLTSTTTLESFKTEFLDKIEDNTHQIRAQKNENKKTNTTTVELVSKKGNNFWSLGSSYNATKRANKATLAKEEFGKLLMATAGNDQKLGKLLMNVATSYKLPSNQDSLTKQDFLNMIELAETAETGLKQDRALQELGQKLCNSQGRGSDFLKERLMAVTMEYKNQMPKGQTELLENDLETIANSAMEVIEEFEQKTSELKDELKNFGNELAKLANGDKILESRLKNVAILHSVPDGRFELNENDKQIMKEKAQVRIQEHKVEVKLQNDREEFGNELANLANGDTFLASRLKKIALKYKLPFGQNALQKSDYEAMKLTAQEVLDKSKESKLKLEVDLKKMELVGETSQGVTPINDRPRIMVAMGQGAVVHSDHYQLYSDSFSTCSPLIFYNEETKMIGLFHVPCPDIDRDVPQDPYNFSLIYDDDTLQSIRDLMDIVKPTQVKLLPGSHLADTDSDSNMKSMEKRMECLQDDMQGILNDLELNTEVDYKLKDNDKSTAVGSIIVTGKTQEEKSNDPFISHKFTGNIKTPNEVNLYQLRNDLSSNPFNQYMAVRSHVGEDGDVGSFMPGNRFGIE